MRYFPELRIETWQYERPASGALSRHRTRLLAGDVELANALERIDWAADPVQVTLCECCALSGCADGGYARIRRVGDHVVWTMPFDDPMDEWELGRHAPSEALERFGAIVIPIEEWDRVVAGVAAEAGGLIEATEDDPAAEVVARHLELELNPRTPSPPRS